MDKKNFPSLDELLNKVRQSEPVVREDEAINWLHAQKELPLQKHRFKPSKIIIMTSIISSLGIVALLWIAGTGRTENLQSTEETMDHRPWTMDSPETMDHRPWTMDSSLIVSDEHFQSSNEGSSGAPVSSSAMVHGPWSMVQNPLSTVDRGPLTIPIDTPRTDTLRVIRIQNDIRELDRTDEVPEIVQEFVFDIQIDPANNIPCRGEVNALVLDPQALKKLGIVSDQGTLLYQQDNTREGQIKLVFQGTMLSKSSRNGTGLSSLAAPDILPLAIINCHGIFQYPGTEIPDSNLLEAALAIRVVVNEKGDYLVFWFPRNNEILAMLPEQTREMIQNSDILYHQKPWSVQADILPLTARVQLKKLPWEPVETTIFFPEDRLHELGIKVDQSGIHFDRQSKIDISENWHNVEIKKQLSEKEQFEETNVKKLQPYYVSKAHFFQGMRQEIMSLNQGTYESFTFDKYRLVAIQVSHPEEGDYLFWYPYSPALKSLLTPEQQKLIEAKLSKIDPAIRFDPERPNYALWEDLFMDEKPATEALNAVQPGMGVLTKLGVVINKDGGIAVNLLDAKNAMMVFEFSKQGTRFNHMPVAPVPDSLTRSNMLASTEAIVSITDDLGMMPRMFNEEVKGYQMNQLIPVLVRSGQTYTLSDRINQNWRPDIILWFKPTQEVLSILESEGAGAIWGDISSTEVPDTSAGNCRYTEVCRNKTGVFNSHLLYPNPATLFANFSWVASEASDYSIKLFAVNGAEVKAFSNLHAEVGKNQYSMDLSGLPAGIYMMILSSDKGDEIHERLVIRE